MRRPEPQPRRLQCRDRQVQCVAVRLHVDPSELAGQEQRFLVSALTVFDDGLGGGPALYAAGFFTEAGGAPVNNIAKWNGTSWSAVGSGIVGGGLALTVFDDGLGGGPALYAGGDFTTAGGVAANRIAKWNGTIWSALGTGMDDTVRALTVFDDGLGGGSALYAGGAFTTADGVPANRIAKWNGTNWSSLGTGMEAPVFALTVFDDGLGGGPALDAGGDFTTAGGASVNFIAKWNGTNWSTFGTGMDCCGVRALTVFDDGLGGGPALYAGGFFIQAGGVTLNYIAKWSGTSWSALGTGMNSAVDALTVFDDGGGGGPALYAGGPFTTAGGVPANRIAKWDGTNWSALGTGMDNWVQALTVFDDGGGGGPALYAGGFFTTAGGVPANRIAKWKRHEVVGPRHRDERRRQLADRLRRRGRRGAGALRGGQLHHGRRPPTQPHREMERRDLVSPRHRDEQHGLCPDRL